VQLAPGTFFCNAKITISADGVVLRGSGSGSGGTTIFMNGNKHQAIIISGGKKGSNQDEKMSNNNFAKINDSYVPSGESAFTVNDVTPFEVGDRIAILRPVTDKWVHFMEMDNLKRDGKPQTWIARSSGNI